MAGVLLDLLEVRCIDARVLSVYGIHLKRKKGSITCFKGHNTMFKLLLLPTCLCSVARSSDSCYRCCSNVLKTQLHALVLQVITGMYCKCMSYVDLNREG